MSKTNIECYRYVNDGEWATIAISDDWFYNKNQYHGEILIHSSFGNFCNSWTNTSIPFKKFLIKMNMTTFGHKTMGRDDTVIDSYATNEALIKQLFKYRREMQVEKHDCRMMYQDITCESWYDVNEYYSWFYSFTSEYELECTQFSMDSPDEFLVEQPNPQLVGFWEKIWALFVNDLKGELEWSKTQNFGE